MTQMSVQQKYLPQSITEEFSEFKHQLQEKSMSDHINNFSTINQTKQAVLAKLGGYFDYPLYLEELRQTISEKDIIEREFKANALVVPEFSEKAFKRVPAYDFSTESIHSSKQGADHNQFFKKASNPGTKEGERPQYLLTLLNQQENEPKAMFNYEEFKQDYSRTIVSQLQPIVQKKIQEYQPKSTKPMGGGATAGSQPGRQTWNQKVVNDQVQKRQPPSSSNQAKAYGSKRQGADLSSPASSKKSGGSQNSSASNSAKKN